jgi:pyruvate dehydrogenase E1 component alpha subunit
VRGVKVDWPKYPSGQELKVSWDLEPRTPKDAGEPLPGLKQPA